MLKPSDSVPSIHLPVTLPHRVGFAFTKDPTGGLSINKHIAQLLDVPLSTITDYFPSKLEFNTALWHYFPVAPENMSAERDGFINGIHEHRPRKFPDLSDSVPPRSTGAKSHGRMDHPMVKGAVVGMQLMLLTGGKLVATTHRVNTLKIDEDR